MTKYLKLKQNIKTNISIQGINKLFMRGAITEVTDEDYKEIQKASSHFFDEVSEDEYKKLLEGLDKKQSAEDTIREKVKKYHDYRIAGHSDSEAREHAGIGTKEKIDETLAVGGIRIIDEKKSEEVVKESKVTKTPNLGEDMIYTEEEAFNLNVDEQKVILKKRGLKTKEIGSSEPERVKQIIETNPKEV